MNLTKIKSLLKQETPLSHNVPITHLVSPDMFETQDGLLGAVLKVKGISYQVTDEETLNQYQHTVHHIIQQLDARFMVMETLHRHLESTHLTGSFRHAFCQQIHDKYHQEFTEKGVYVNDYYLTLLFKGEAAKHSKKGIVNKLILGSNQLIDKTIIDSKASQRMQGIKALNQKITQWLTSLSQFGVTRLSENNNGSNELIQFLSLVPNGGRPVGLKTSFRYAGRSKNFNQHHQMEQIYPNGHLGQYITKHRLFFGEAIQFQGNTRDDCQFGALLSIKDYSTETNSLILSPLLGLGAEFIRTQTFCPIELDDSIKAIESAHSKKISANDYAVSQIEELGNLADLVAGGRVILGLHHSTLMLLSTTKEALEKSIAEATQAYAQADMVVIRETIAEPLCFFAQIPGNSRFIARAALITSKNFADFCSFHNTPTGYRDRCLLGEPITLVKTLQKTPVFWNYHKPGSIDSPSSGHSLIIGSNGSGKTVLASFLDAEMSRFKGHRTFFLDRNFGAKIYILACDGTYLTLDPAHQNECRMNPLQLEDNEENRAFCKSWMQALLFDEGENSIDSVTAEQINEVVNYGFDHLAPKDRRLSTVATLLPIDFARWPQLRRWLRESSSREAGQYAWAFDNIEDVLNFNADKTGIDLTYLMDYLPASISTPFYMYLLHRIKLSLNGTVTSIIIDEMWQVLKTPYWINALDHYLPTIRKLLGHIVGMTQSPETVINSPINDVLLNNNASLVLFTNPKAQERIYKDALNLTQGEYNLIRSHAADSRLLLYKQDNESIFCQIDLSAIQDELPVLAGNINSVMCVNQLRNELGTKACDWLPAFLNRNHSHA